MHRLLQRLLQDRVEELYQREEETATTPNQASLATATSWSTLTPPPGVFPIAVLASGLNDQMTYLEDLIERFQAMRHMPQHFDETDARQNLEDELDFRVEELRWLRIMARSAATETAGQTPSHSTHQARLSPWSPSSQPR